MKSDITSFWGQFFFICPMKLPKGKFSQFLGGFLYFLGAILINFLCIYSSCLQFFQYDKINFSLQKSNTLHYCLFSFIGCSVQGKNRNFAHEKLRFNWFVFILIKKKSNKITKSHDWRIHTIRFVKFKSKHGRISRIMWRIILCYSYFAWILLI